MPRDTFSQGVTSLGRDGNGLARSDTEIHSDFFVISDEKGGSRNVEGTREVAFKYIKISLTKVASLDIKFSSEISRISVHSRVGWYSNKRQTNTFQRLNYSLTIRKKSFYQKLELIPRLALKPTPSRAFLDKAINNTLLSNIILLHHI